MHTCIFTYVHLYNHIYTWEGVLVVKTLDFGTVVSEFGFQSLYYVYFRTNTLGKGKKSLILQAMGLIVPQLF